MEHQLIPVLLDAVNTLGLIRVALLLILVATLYYGRDDISHGIAWLGVEIVKPYAEQWRRHRDERHELQLERDRANIEAANARIRADHALAQLADAERAKASDSARSSGNWRVLSGGNPRITPPPGGPGT